MKIHSLDLEEAFYASDFGVDTTEELINSSRAKAHRENRELRAEGVGVIARTVLKEIFKWSRRGRHPDSIE